MPGGQSVQDADPGRAYLPAGHRAAVGDMDPEVHAYPPVQLPLQAAVDSADVAPKVPPGQGVHVGAAARL